MPFTIYDRLAISMSVAYNLSMENVNINLLPKDLQRYHNTTMHINVFDYRKYIVTFMVNNNVLYKSFISEDDVLYIIKQAKLLNIEYDHQRCFESLADEMLLS